MTRADAIVHARAAAWLVAARAGLRVAPVRTLRRTPRPGAPRPAFRRSAAELAAIVDRVADAVGGACLPRSIAARCLLAQYGLHADLVIGAAKRGGCLHAHAWLECDGRVLGPSRSEPFIPIWRNASLLT